MRVGCAEWAEWVETPPWAHKAFLEHTMRLSTRIVLPLVAALALGTASVATADTGDATTTAQVVKASSKSGSKAKHGKKHKHSKKHKRTKSGKGRHAKG